MALPKEPVWQALIKAYREMAEPHVLTGLISKRAEIAGQIEHTQDKLRQLMIDLDHVDGAIHIFNPDIELEKIKARPPPPQHQAFRGEVTRILLAALRNAKQPLTTADLTPCDGRTGVRHGRCPLTQDNNKAHGSLP